MFVQGHLIFWLWMIFRLCNIFNGVANHDLVFVLSVQVVLVLEKEHNEDDTGK